MCIRDRSVGGLASAAAARRDDAGHNDAGNGAQSGQGEITMPPLAQRNLFHDKVRLAVTLTGIAFAVVLIVVELGLFVGFTVTTSGPVSYTHLLRLTRSAESPTR